MDGTEIIGPITLTCGSAQIDVTATNGSIISELRKMGSLSNVQIGVEITDEQIAEKKSAHEAKKAEQPRSFKDVCNLINSRRK